MADKKLKITLVRSTISGKVKQKATVEALGLKKIGQFVTQPDSPCTRGMIKIVSHLVTVEEA